MFPRWTRIPLLTLLMMQPISVRAEPPVDGLGDPLPLHAVARLGSSRLRHGGSISGLVFSPDGRRLASWGGTYQVADGLAIWEVESGKELHRVLLPGRWLDTWAWQPDGHLLATLQDLGPERRRSLIDFDAARVEPRGLPPEDEGNDRRFAISPDGSLLAVSRNGRDGRGYSLEFRTLGLLGPDRKFKTLRVGHGPLEYATILRFTPDGKTLVVSSPPQGEPRRPEWTEVVWDVATATPRLRLTLPELAHGLDQSEAISNERAAYGFADGSVVLLDLKSGEKKHLPGCHKPSPAEATRSLGTVVALTADGKTLVTTGADQAIRFWNIADGKLIRELAWRKGRVERMAVSPDGRLLAVGGVEGVIWLLNASTGAEVCPQPGHDAGVRAVTVSTDGRQAATASLDGTLRVWDLPTARESRTITRDALISDCAFTPDSKALLAGVYRDHDIRTATLHLWNPTSGQEIRGTPTAGARAALLRFSADGKSLVTLCSDRVEIRDWPQGTRRCQIALPPGALPPLGTFLAISPDGNRLGTMTRHVTMLRGIDLDAAGASLDLWEMSGGKHVRQLAGSGGRGVSGAFNSAGELIIAGEGSLLPRDDEARFREGALHVFDVATGKLKRLIPLPARASAVALSPDGRTAYLGGDDGTIRAVEIATGAIRFSLAGHHDIVTDLVVLPGGRRLLSASRDASCLVWDLTSPLEAEKSRARAPAVVAVAGQPNLLMGSYDVAPLGYQVDEFFISGTAASYRLAGEAAADGKWDALPAGTAPYTTRIVVVRPRDPAKFSGTAVVEWLNVSGGLDVPVDWNMTHREIVRRGHAYVGVSAQKVGVEGGPGLMSIGLAALKRADPKRYGGLSHPGDAYSFDIFSQAGRLVKDAAASKVLGPLVPARLIAIGESQSAFYLTTYANAVDPVARVYDGILIHSRAAVAAPLDGSSLLAALMGPTRSARLRPDLRVPVLAVITESDLLGWFPLLGYHATRQADTDRLRVWEIAGTAHADNYSFTVGFIDSGSLPAEKFAAAYAPTSEMLGRKLDRPMNYAPQHHYVVEAALWQLDRWVRTGQPAPKALALKLTEDKSPKLVTDAKGLAVGGVRTPWVDVPTAVLSGAGGMVGFSQPFDAATLGRLYPGGKAEYLRKFGASLDAAIRAGFIVPEDRAEIMELAALSFTGKSEPSKARE